MPNREEIHICVEKLLVATTAAADATPVNSTALDTQGFDSAHFNLHIGAVFDGAMTYKVQESEDNVTFTDAVAAEVIDDGSALVASKTKRVAYVGSQRYARIQVTPVALDVYTVTGHMGYAAQKPTDNPA